MQENELIRKIVQVCATCPHLMSRGGWHCDRRKSQCHSKRVQKWLGLIDELEDIPIDPRLRHNARERQEMRQKYAGKE